MAPGLLAGVDLDALRDQEDCVRRVLAETTLPRSAEELVSILGDYVRSGMATYLPSGRRHCDVCDVRSILKDLEASGWVHKIKGSTWDELAAHTDGLKATLSHDYPTDDGRMNRVVEWAASDERDAWDPKADHYAMTHAGFEALTGHKQGERPENEPEEPVDPADVKPASIGDS